MCLSFCVASALTCNILFGTYTSTHLRYICPRTAKSTTLRTNDTAALIYDSEESHFPFPRSTSGRHPSSNGRNHVKKNTLERRLYYKIYVTVCVCYTTKNSYMKRGQAVFFFFVRIKSVSDLFIWGMWVVFCRTMCCQCIISASTPAPNSWHQPTHR